MAQSASDVVFIDTLRLSATIGPDCWNKEREQPIEITLYLYLRDGFLKAAGESDDVLDSVHYGLLTKEITKLVRSEKSVYKSGDDLVDAVTKRAFDFAQDAVDRVRVVLAVPKIILLAESFALDVIIAKQPFAVLQKTVNVKDIVIPVIIGVNPPERESKQRVIVNITINEVPSLEGTPLDYPALVANLIKDIEVSQYLTLEKFVMEIVKGACLSSPSVLSVTVRAQKPSALSFAQSSGVEITRRREAFLRD